MENLNYERRQVSRIQHDVGIAGYRYSVGV